MIEYEINHKTGVVIVYFFKKRIGEIRAHIRNEFNGRVAYVYWAKSNVAGKYIQGDAFDTLTECKKSLKAK